MDPTTFALGLVSGIVVGAVVGWVAHVFALKRSSKERTVVDATERIDRCYQMVAARVAYAATWHRGGRWQLLKDERLTYERKYPLDVPAIVLDGSDEWATYIATEQRVREEAQTAGTGGKYQVREIREGRAKEIEDAGAAVLRRLDAMRAKVRH